MEGHDNIIKALIPQINKIYDKELIFDCFTSMRGEFLAFDKHQNELTAKFPFLKEQRNPLGCMQGGFIVAAMDNTLGPLCFLGSTPGVTTQLNVSYVRPVTPNDEYIWVKAKIIAITTHQTFIRAIVTNKDDKIISIGHSTFVSQVPK